MAQRPDVVRRATELRRELGNPRMVLLGIDRLDYTKGIESRLQAFLELMEDGALTVPDAVAVQVATPSRDHTPAYRTERARIERLVGEINGRFSQVGSPALHYIHRGLDHPEIAALYRAADVMLVTPIHDGMNLIAKEFVASRVAHRGVLVLSEFAGASHELRDAILVNPHDIESIKHAILQAVSMPTEEMTARRRAMQEVLARHTVHDWAAQFVSRLIPTPIEH